MMLEVFGVVRAKGQKCDPIQITTDVLYLPRIRH